MFRSTSRWIHGRRAVHLWNLSSNGVSYKVMDTLPPKNRMPRSPRGTRISGESKRDISIWWVRFHRYRSEKFLYKGQNPRNDRNCRRVTRTRVPAPLLTQTVTRNGTEDPRITVSECRWTMASTNPLLPRWFTNRVERGKRGEVSHPEEVRRPCPKKKV